MVGISILGFFTSFSNYKLHLPSWFTTQTSFIGVAQSGFVHGRLLRWKYTIKLLGCDALHFDISLNHFKLEKLDLWVGIQQLLFQLFNFTFGIFKLCKSGFVFFFNFLHLLDCTLSNFSIFSIILKQCVVDILKFLITFIEVYILIIRNFIFFNLGVNTKLFNQITQFIFGIMLGHMWIM